MTVYYSSNALVASASAGGSTSTSLPGGWATARAGLFLGDAKKIAQEPESRHLQLVFAAAKLPRRHALHPFGLTLPRVLLAVDRCYVVLVVITQNCNLTLCPDTRVSPIQLRISLFQRIQCTLGHPGGFLEHFHRCVPKIAFPSHNQHWRVVLVGYTDPLARRPFHFGGITPYKWYTCPQMIP